MTLYYCTACSVHGQLVQTSREKICTCPGDQLILKCTVTSGKAGTTIFRKIPSFTDCSVTDTTEQEIVLLHSKFNDNIAAITCNNNSIVGRSLKIENGSRYASQLQVTISSELVGGIIECLHDNGIAISLVGNITINVKSEQ